MFCPYCGATNPDDAAFCRSCRRTISIPTDPGSQPPQQTGPWQAPYYERDPYGQQPPAMMYAAFWPRFGAYLLDALFSLLIAAIPAVIIALVVGLAVASGQDEARTQLQEDQQTEDVIVAVVIGAFAGFYPVYLAYHTIANAKGGGWGKRIVGLRVFRERDAALPGYGTGFLRTIVPTIIGIVPLIGGLLQLLDYLWSIWDSQKQTWHDKISGTVVVVAK